MLPQLYLLIPSFLTDEYMVFIRKTYSSILEQLLFYAQHINISCMQIFQKANAYELWLSNYYGLNDMCNAPLAPFMLLGDGGKPNFNESWFCVEPVHLEILNNQLKLHNLSSLNTEFKINELHILQHIASSVFEKRGLKLITPTPYRWYVKDLISKPFKAASITKVSGKNIDLSWLPQTIYKSTNNQNRNVNFWINLQNEIQILWHNHAINKNKFCPINSIWLYSYGKFIQPMSKFNFVFSNTVSTRGLAIATGNISNKLPPDFHHLYTNLKNNKYELNLSTNNINYSNYCLIEYDDLLRARLAENIHDWQEAIIRLDNNWFLPLMSAIIKGKFSFIKIVLTGDTRLYSISISQHHLYKFWNRWLLGKLNKKLIN